MPQMISNMSPNVCVVVSCTACPNPDEYCITDFKEKFRAYQVRIFDGLRICNAKLTISILLIEAPVAQTATLLLPRDICHRKSYIAPTAIQIVFATHADRHVRIRMLRPPFSLEVSLDSFSAWMAS